MKKIYQPGGLLTALTLFLAISACSTSPKEVMGGADDELSSRQAALSEQEAQLKEREAALAQREKDIQAKAASMQTSSQPAMADGGNYGAGDMLPPDAQPGECYSRVWVEPEYKTVTKRVLVRDASEKIEVVPAKYQTAKQRVMVEEASTKLVTVPATYKTVTERVMIKPASKKIVTTPAVYETVKERVLDKPAHTTWKKGTGPIQRIDDTTGEIMCLVEVPASYKTISRRVLKTPAGTQTVEEPAVFKTVTKKVVATPATTKTVEIPAKYATIDVTEIASPAQEKRVEIPAEYSSVTTREMVSNGRMEWRSILCETNTTKAKITQIQEALLKAGYDPGPIDGAIGVETMRAVNNYQRAKGLPVDKYLNIATVKSLGVSPN